jgi:hypothetical protein
MRLTRVAVAAMLITVASSSRVAAQAQTSPPSADHSRAADLKRSADAAFDARRYDEAVSLYDQSYALDAQPNILYNRGRALQYLARYPEALEQLERFQSQASPELRAKVPGFDAVLADVRAHVATLDIRCSVAGARVLVATRAMGTTPLPGPLRVTAGNQTVEVDADGYFPYAKAQMLVGGAPTTLNVTLVPRDKHGLLSVRSNLGGSNAFVDGLALGLVPAEAALLEGTHGVVVSHDGYSDATTQIVLTAGEHQDITLDPQKSPSIFSRWWFWTGVAVVVAGVATSVTVYALTTEGSAPNGSFSPGTLKF